MTIQKVRSKLYNALGDDRMDDALGLLIDHVKKEGEVWEKLCALRTDYNRLKTRILQRTVDLVDADLERNRLSGVVLDFFHDLQADDLRPDGAYSAQLIDNPVLFLTHNTKQNQDVQVFAEMLKFSQVVVRNLMAYTPEDEAYDLVVFDNQDLSPCESREQMERGEVDDIGLMEDRLHLMERYRQKTNYYFIHYGPYSFYPDQYKNRFVQASTRLGLYTRIREVLRFLDAYRM